MGIEDIRVYDKHNLNSNELQSSIKKFIFSEGVLSDYTESTITGEFMMITIDGFDNGSGEIIGYIFCEK